MPCRDDWQYYQHDSRDYDDLSRRLDLVTRFACEAMALVESAGQVRLLTAAAGQWWNQHKAEDEKRKEAEKTRQNEEERQRAQKIVRLEEELARLRAVK